MISINKSRYKIDKKTGCWEWQGALNKCGYGNIYIDGKWINVHRLSYKLLVGELRPHKEVCHRCDNKKCFNPDHLFLGTHTENILDSRIKKRIKEKKYINHHIHKLTREKVKDIKFLIKKCKYYYKEIAKMYDVHPETIRQIAKGERWSDVVI